MKKHIRIALATLCLLIWIGCDKEEENVSQIDGVSLIDTDEGFKFTLTYPDGTERKVKGTKVFGTSNGYLLDGDYYKHLSGGSNEISFDFRFSVPKTIQILNVIEGNHQLRSQRLRLEQTGNLGALQTEFWLGTTEQEDEFDGYTNVTGTARYQQNIAAIGDRIAIAVEIEGSVVDRAGETVLISGIFWKAKDDDIR